MRNPLRCMAIGRRGLIASILAAIPLTGANPVHAQQTTAPAAPRVVDRPQTTAPQGDLYDQSKVGELKDGRIVVPTNQVLSPMGRQVAFPGRPTDLALSPDRRLAGRSEYRRRRDDRRRDRQGRPHRGDEERQLQGHRFFAGRQTHLRLEHQGHDRRLRRGSRRQADARDADQTARQQGSRRQERTADRAGDRPRGQDAVGRAEPEQHAGRDRPGGRADRSRDPRGQRAVRRAGAWAARPMSAIGRGRRPKPGDATGPSGSGIRCASIRCGTSPTTARCRSSIWTPAGRPQADRRRPASRGPGRHARRPLRAAWPMPTATRSR